MILMGDSLNDPNMTGGMEDEPENLIKIGYLNHNVINHQTNQGCSYFYSFLHFHRLSSSFQSIIIFMTSF